jgi:molybdate transport system substrate-binding protein
VFSLTKPFTAALRRDSREIELRNEPITETKINRRSILRWGGGLAVAAVVGAGVGGTVMSRFMTPHKIRAYFGSAAEVPEEELVAAFQKETEISVEYTMGGSGTLLSAIEIAKVGDLYAPGSQDYMQKAINDGIMVNSSIKTLAYLVPAIIVQKGNPNGITSLSDLAKPGLKVGIGNPDSVCVGLYAYDILTKAGLWDSVKPNLVTYASSCSNTAALVVTKSVDAIIGWHVFYNWTPDKVDIVYIKPEQIPKIAYIPIGITKYADDPASAQKLIDYLLSPEGKAVFSKYGYFSTLEEAKKLAPYATAESLTDGS